jgi:hypothetical protein
VSPPDKDRSRPEGAASTVLAPTKTALSVADSYPFKPYPGFSDPEDWRESIARTAPDDRRALIVRELCASANADHVAKHQQHEHPWCRECYVRYDAFWRAQDNDDPAPMPPYKAEQCRLERTSTQLTDAQTEQIERFRFDGFAPKPGDGALIGVDDETFEAWFDYLKNVDEWEDWNSEASHVPARRANRYMIMHGRPPVDSYDPEAETGLEDEYLWRDELNNLEPAEQLIAQVLPAHSYGVLRGRDGTYKTFVALDWALCLATGKPWQGHALERTKVLYVAGEGAHGLAGRIDAWEQSWHIDVDPDWLVVRKSALNLHRPGPAFEHLLTVITENDIGLVVIDTLRRVAGGADGNSSEMGAVVDNLDLIKRATDGGSVLVIAHTSKDDHDTRGYSGIEDDADFVWHAKRDEQLLMLTNAKMKDGPDGAAIHLAARPVHGSLVIEAADAADLTSTASQVTILDTLRHSFRDGAYSGQLLEASGLAKATFYRALAGLKEAGHITNSGTPMRPFWSLGVSAEPTPDHAQRSHESHSVSPSVSPSGEEVSPVSPPFRARHETNDHSDPQPTLHQATA